MKEARITAVVGTYGCLILANISTGKIIPMVWIGLTMFWAVRYIYLKVFK